MKLCMDCEHFLPSPHESLCRCAALQTTSPITGKPIHDFCAVERATLYGPCGPDGKLFEPREEVA